VQYQGRPEPSGCQRSRCPSSPHDIASERPSDCIGGIKGSLPAARGNYDLIILGIILLIIGFVAKIAIVWTIGIVVLVLGLIAALLGSIGHAIGGGRRHYC
jgi:hypothetical protein